MEALNETEIEILQILDPVEAAKLNREDPIDILYGSRQVQEFIVWAAGSKAFFDVCGQTGKINGDALDRLEKWIGEARYFYNAEYLDISPEIEDLGHEAEV